MNIEDIEMKQLNEWKSWWITYHQTFHPRLPIDTPPFSEDEIDDEIEYRKNHGE